jgi:DNA-binding transcriptional MocR family regulator
MVAVAERYCRRSVAPARVVSVASLSKALCPGVR